MRRHTSNSFGSGGGAGSTGGAGGSTGSGSGRSTIGKIRKSLSRRMSLSSRKSSNSSGGTPREFPSVILILHEQIVVKNAPRIESRTRNPRCAVYFAVLPAGTLNNSSNSMHGDADLVTVCGSPRSEVLSGVSVVRPLECVFRQQRMGCCRLRSKTRERDYSAPTQ